MFDAVAQGKCALMSYNEVFLIDSQPWNHTDSLAFHCYSPDCLFDALLQNASKAARASKYNANLEQSKYVLYLIGSCSFIAQCVYKKTAFLLHVGNPNLPYLGAHSTVPTGTSTIATTTKGLHSSLPFPD